MFEPLIMGRTPIGELCWQLSLFLVGGLAASTALRRRPARAHRVLLMAAIAGMATPALSRLASLGGWGFLPGPAPSESRTRAPDGAESIQLASLGPPVQSQGPPREEPIRPSLDDHEAPQAVPPSRQQSLSMANILLSLWAIASSAFLFRVCLSLALGRRVVRQAASRSNLVLEQAAEMASRRVGLLGSPDTLLLPCPGSGHLVLGPKAHGTSLPDRLGGGQPGELDRGLLPRAGSLGARRPLVGPARGSACRSGPVESACLDLPLAPGPAWRTGLRRLGNLVRAATG